MHHGLQMYPYQVIMTSCVYRPWWFLQAVVCAGKNFADMFGEQKTYDAYQLIELDAYWGRKLAKCKVCVTFTVD